LILVGLEKVTIAPTGKQSCRYVFHSKRGAA
jgi:hypothetical protein